MLLENKKIAVIGAGPVGLLFAKLVQQEGVSVKVYERDKDEHTRIKGGTLDIHHDYGQIALEKAGLLADYYQRSRPTGERAADTDGHILRDEFPSQEHLYHRPEIDRNDLRQLFLEHLDAGTVIWDSALTTVKQEGEKYVLYFENGNKEVVDLVVGANGGRSNLQQYITHSKPKYTGTILIQGEVLHPSIVCPNFKRLCGDGNFMVIGEQKLLFAQTKGTGALNYYVSFRTPETWIHRCELNFQNNKEVSSFINELLYTWNSVYKELFNATDAFTLLPMKNITLDQWLPHDNITLIGDAAHLMPPFSGIGVNIGLLDAMHLAENLTNGQFSTVKEAISNYEDKMFVYATKAALETTEAEESIHADKDFDEIIKNKR